MLHRGPIASGLAALAVLAAMTVFATLEWLPGALKDETLPPTVPPPTLTPSVPEELPPPVEPSMQRERSAFGGGAPLVSDRSGSARDDSTASRDAPRCRSV